MYTNPEEARSDLLLAAAVYLFGPLLLEVLGPLYRVPVLGAVLAVVAQLATTALVPVLMARYRKEPASNYGLTGERGPGLRFGALLAAPLVVAVALGFALRPLALGGTLASLVVSPDLGGVVGLLVNAAGWLGLVVLAVYATVKARDAFRSELRTVRDGMFEVGRVLAVAGGVATVVLFASSGFEALLLLLPAGAAGAVYALLRGLRGSSTTTRAALIAPVVLLALRPFNLIALFGAPESFLASVWAAAIVGTVGLLVGASLESRRSAWPAVGLAALLALFVPVALDVLVLFLVQVGG